MEEEIINRIEAKLDLVIDLLRDRILTAGEVALIHEADRRVKSKDFQEFVQLFFTAPLRKQPMSGTSGSGGRLR